MYFRWTPRTAKITFIYVALIPSIMGYIAYKTDVSFNTVDVGDVGTDCTTGNVGFPREAKG